MDHNKTLASVVKAAKAMLPIKREAQKIIREIERQEAREAAQSAPSTIGETEPEE